jgi:hypothetical protein
MQNVHMRAHPHASSIANAVAGYRPIAPVFGLPHTYHRTALLTPGGTNHVRPPATFYAARAPNAGGGAPLSVEAIFQRLQLLSSTLCSSGCTEYAVHQITNEFNHLASRVHGHPMFTTITNQVRTQIHSRQQQICTARAHHAAHVAHAASHAQLSAQAQASEINAHNHILQIAQAQQQQ